MTHGESAPLQGGGLSALRGRGGRLFLERDGDWRADVAYAASNPVFPRLEQAWRCVLETRGRLLKKRGLHLYVLVCPDAHFIYRDEISEALDLPAQSPGRQFAERMAGIDNVTIIHPEAQLIAARGGLDVYMANDTHWSTYGAFIAYQALIDAMAPGTPMRPLRAAQIDYRFIRLFGDLGVLVEPELPLEVPHPIPAGPIREEWKRSDEYRNQWVRTTSERGLGKLFLIHDSFAHSMSPFLEQTFAQVDRLASKTRQCLEAIDREKPDVVIWEMTERVLRQPVPDEHPKTAYETFAYDPGDPAGKLALEACDFRDAGQFARAVASSGEALKLSPSDVNLHYLRGTLLLKQGDNEGAERSARAAVAVRDDRPACWQLLATALRTQSRWPDALAASRRAYRLSSDNVFYVTKFGQDLLAVGQVDRAVEIMSRCRKDVSTSIALCNFLAQACLRSGDPVRALAEAQHVRMLSPGHPAVERFIAKIAAEFPAVVAREGTQDKSVE